MDTDISEAEEDILDAEEVIEVSESAEEPEPEEDSDEESAEEPIQLPDRSEEITYVIPPEKWQTTNIVSIFEQAYLTSLRATEIEMSPGTITIDITGLDNAIDIAKRELMLRKCPLNIQRVVAKKEVIQDGVRRIVTYVEIRSPNDMEFSVIYD